MQSSSYIGREAKNGSLNCSIRPVLNNWPTSCARIN